MATDASRTRKRLDWTPRPRLDILRRMPFLIENMKTDPVAWAELNRAAMKDVRVPANLKIHWLLEQHQEAVMRDFTALLTGPDRKGRFAHYQALARPQIEWHVRLIYRNLLSAVRTRDKGVFMGYCRDLAEQRMKEGFNANELCGALEALNLVCWRVLRRDPESNGMREAIFDYVTSTLRSGCDQAQEVFELAEARSTAPPSNGWDRRTTLKNLAVGRFPNPAGRSPLKSLTGLGLRMRSGKHPMPYRANSRCRLGTLFRSGGLPPDCRHRQHALTL